MRCYELTRKVSAGPLTIRLWVAVPKHLSEDVEETADELALCAATLADEDDHPIDLADRLTRVLNLSAVEVVSDDGDGCRIRMEQSNDD